MSGPLNSRPRLMILVAVALIALAVRAVWLTADPPSDPTVGIVWHDEGAWVHSARNKALWGEWRTDNWNPVFLAPVFSGLEYAAFTAFGVGTWQARTVPLVSGLLAVLAIGWGLAAFAGYRAALVGTALLATNFFFVMWNRAALMESTMTALIVVSWAAYARAHAGRPTWGVVSGVAAVLAFFTKAAAAFFVGALALDAALTWIATLSLVQSTTGMANPSPQARLAARWAIGGLIAGGLVAVAVFVIPWWSEFRFYNWEMSVTRKPEYTIRAFVNRASWLPIVHDVFTRMWPVFVAAMLGLIALVARWKTVPPALRLLGLWLLMAFAELVIHDSGNERRYVMLVPALIAIAAWLTAGRLESDPDESAKATPRWLLTPLVLFTAYLVCGSAIRVADLDAIYAHDLKWTVRTSAVLAVALAAGVLWQWPSLARAIHSIRQRSVWLGAMLAVAIGMDAWYYVNWARTRTDLNYQASIEAGRLLPPGTLVHGKLANGLSLENQIRPVFVGREFGNYADRLDRTDIRYLLTYIQPKLGYEGPVIVDVLEHLPGERIIATFPVQETAGEDVAALIDKFPR